MALTEAEINKRVSDSYEVENNVLEAVPNPLVSIRTSTYNHGPYIKQCIEGVLMQKTNFAFEYIIGEDFSTDETREIVFDYARKYPNIIRVITADYNVGSKANGRRCINACRGKYMALCEGDDYWTDPLKLQKQVDFLEGHPEYTMCFHNACVLNETNYKFELVRIENRDYDIRELFEEWLVPTASILAIKKVFDKYTSHPDLLNGDIFIVLSAVSLGKVRGMKDVMSVYRLQDKGLTISRVKDAPMELEKKYVKHFLLLKSIFSEIPQKSLNKRLSNTYINIGILYRTRNPFLFIYYILRAFYLSPKMFCKRLANLLNRM